MRAITVAARTRRALLTGAAGAAAGLGLDLGPSAGGPARAAGRTEGQAGRSQGQAGRSQAGRRVAVLGGGVAGLSAAQELAERGYRVTVYERNRALGGKARSMDVPGTARGGRRPLPGEHGFRGPLPPGPAERPRPGLTADPADLGRRRGPGPGACPARPATA